MKILGRPRTWLTIAAVWAALIDVLALANLESDNRLSAGALLAVPAVGALAAALTLRRWVAIVALVLYAVLAILSILTVGIFLGPGLLAMIIGTILIGVEPRGE